MKNPTKIIGFRVSMDEYERLSKEARLQKDPLTAGEYAREILLNRHENKEDEGRLALEVACLKDEIKELRRDLAVAVKALLITKGGQAIVTPEQADQWVKQYLSNAA